MAKSTTPKAAAFEPDAMYRVKVNRVVTIAGVKFKPANDYRVRGSALSDPDVKDAIESAEKV